ncbi:MAG: hypothetical protein JO290_02615 [Sphingomonadaceae bacterium]|nr:hypothetical protein [Sphingomonadaceae bacterium]
MRTTPILAALAAAVTLQAATPAMAQDRYYYDREHHRHYYHGSYRCKRSSGTTGAIAGAVGGGVIGNAVGGGLLGTAAGAVGGGLLGRHLDKKHDEAQNRRNGC